MKHEIDMCNGSVWKKMLLFAVPLMCSGVLQLLFNAADIAVVGRFAGDNSLAAVGSTTSLINLLINLFVGLSIGANVLVARYFAAGQERELKETVHTAMLVSIISGLFLTVVGIVAAKKILVLMQAPPAVLELSAVYLRIYFIGMTSTMVYNFGSAILRAVGDTKRPLYYLMIAGVINVVLNLFFVIVLHMDVAGVATATVISQTVSAILVLRCLIKEQGGIRVDLKALHIYPDKLMRIVQIGLPAGFQGCLFSLSNVFIQSAVNSFDEIVVAGNSASGNLEGFVYVAMNAFYQAAISFTGQNVGAGKYERINKIAYSAEICVIAIGLILGNLVVLFGETLLGIYSKSAEVIEAGMVRLRIISSTYALCGMMDVMVGVLRGLGYSVVPMIVSLVGACGLRLLFLATLFRLEAFHSIDALYMMYPITWIITFIAHVVSFLIIRRKLVARRVSYFL